MDEHAYNFMRKYSGNDDLVRLDVILVKATDPMMPETTLSEKEADEGFAIIRHLVGDLWDKYMSDEDINLTRFEWNVIMWIGNEWLQSEDVFNRYADGIKAFDTVGKGSWKGE